MDLYTAIIVSEMEDKEDLLGLIEYSTDLIAELMDEVNLKNVERAVELHHDIFEIREVIDRMYEKIYGKKPAWKSTNPYL
jgi:hypothetical protein